MKTNTSTSGLLYFTRSERSGIAFFSLLCLLIFWLPSRFSSWKPSSKTDFSIYQQEIAVFKTRQSAPLILSENMNADTLDPNSATEEDLLSLGIPDRVVNTLINYRSKGGVFRQKEDLQKVYGFTDDLYAKLAPYIQLDVGMENKNSTNYERKAPPESLDINLASAEEWSSLPGIGPVLSGRIVKFRDKLGGFVEVEQVAETYGLPDSTFQKIASYLTASPITPLLKINRCSVEELQAHPYLNWRQAKAIINYRIQHGYFKDLEDFAKIRVLSEEQKAKLVSYLSFE